MALGTNNSQNNTPQEASYYSRLRIKNASDNLTLGFTFWNGILTAVITDSSNNASAENRRANELAKFSFSPFKALSFAECIDRVMKSKDDTPGYGVDGGFGEVRGFIAIGKELGKPYLFIAKVNKDGGYESSQRFNFNHDYNYLLQIHDINKLSVQREYLNDMELQMFKTLLLDFARNSSGAAAYTIWDIGRYETKKLSSLINRIGDKVGVERYTSNRQANSGFSFNNSSESSSDNKRTSRFESIDDLDSEFE